MAGASAEVGDILRADELVNPEKYQDSRQLAPALGAVSVDKASVQ